jgi:calcium-dependent protein kinase
MAQHMSRDEVQGLKELFESMDTDHSGTISLDELRQGLLQRGVLVPEQLLRQIMDMADLNGNRCLDYEEFVGATMHVCKLQQEDKLIEAFKVCERAGAQHLQHVHAHQPAASIWWAVHLS